MKQNIKQLSTTITPRGTNIKGLTAILVQRTDQVAWYTRNDGYHEIFIIKIGPSFDKQGMMEYYPGNNDFGITAYCTRFADTAARYYSDLCLHQTINERSAPEWYDGTNNLKTPKIEQMQLELLC